MIQKSSLLIIGCNTFKEKPVTYVEDIPSHEITIIMALLLQI